MSLQKPIVVAAVAYAMLQEISNRYKKKPEKIVEDLILREYHKRY